MLKFPGQCWILPLILSYYSREAKKSSLLISLAFKNLRSHPNWRTQPNYKK